MKASYKTLSEEIGVSSSSIGKVMRGQNSFSYRNAKRAVKILGGNLDTWLDSSQAIERQLLYCEYRLRD